jgi:hypothetical protein
MPQTIAFRQVLRTQGRKGNSTCELDSVTMLLAIVTRLIHKTGRGVD